jgi:hypothetical protein
MNSKIAIIDIYNIYKLQEISLPSCFTLIGVPLGLHIGRRVVRSPKAIRKGGGKSSVSEELSGGEMHPVH